MGSLVVVIAWVLIRHLLADKNVRASVTSLNPDPSSNGSGTSEFVLRADGYHRSDSGRVPRQFR